MVYVHVPAVAQVMKPSYNGRSMARWITCSSIHIFQSAAVDGAMHVRQSRCFTGFQGAVQLQLPVRAGWQPLVLSKAALKTFHLCRTGKLLRTAPNPPVSPDAIAPQPVAVAAALAAPQCIALALIALKAFSLQQGAPLVVGGRELTAGRH